MALAGVLGYPVGHSRSPIMMSAAFLELGLDWRYVKLPVQPELFVETVRALPASGYVGANVTIPHKLAALDPGRRAEPGRRGDRGGQHAELRRRSHQGRQHRRRRPARRARGAGGGPAGARAGRRGRGPGRRWALRQAGAEVAVWNRTRGRAAALAAELDVAHAETPGPTDLLVNATSVGLAPDTGRTPRSRPSSSRASHRPQPSWTSCTETRPRRSGTGPRAATRAWWEAWRCWCARAP